MSNLLINQGTNSAINFDLSGTVNTQVVAIGYGTISTVGTLPNLPGGTLNNLVSGTINAATAVLNSGTINVATAVVSGGTIQSATAVLNSGTINVGTFVANGGTIQSATAVLNNGTINVATVNNGSIVVTAGTQTTGTVNTGTVNTGTINTGTINVATVAAGSIVVTAGTVIGNGGSMISYGPAAAAAAAAGNPLNVGGTDSGGTIRTIKVDSGGLQRIGVDSGTISVLPNLPQGSINVTAGTISAGTINTGTINAGTINTGTINVGTFVNNGGSVQITDNTNIANVVNLGTGSLGTANQNAILTAGGFSQLTGTVTSAADIISSVDVSNYRFYSLHTVGTFTGTVQIQGGNDNINYTTNNVVGFNPGNNSASFVNVTNLSGNNLIYGPIVSRYLKIKMTAYTSGTAAGFLQLYSHPSPVHTMGVSASQSGAYNVTGTVATGTINTGTINAGTINTGTINVGTINVATVTAGTINIGTVVGKDANAAAQTGNPIGIGGTDSGGTIRTVLVDSTGAMKVNGVSAGTTIGTINVGTINTGTINTGTINVATITAGSIIVTAGTQSVGTVNAGTINTGTVNAGTINVGTITVGTIYKGVAAPTAGSFTAAGTITVAGSQLDFAAFDAQGTWVGTVFTEGQIGTSGWFALPYTTNLGVIGTSFTGNGDYFVSMSGLDGVRARLTYSSGTLTYNARQSNFFAPVHYNLGGSIGNIGTVNSGSVVITAGTQSVGTVNTGTINVATVTAGTINTGTINTGTFRGDARTTQNIISFGTRQANSGAAAATIVGSASVGAGTSLWVNDLSIMNEFSAATVILGFGTAQQGTNVLFRGVLGTTTAVGIEKTYAKAVNAGMTNQDLVLSTTGAGTVDLSISYFISA